MPVQQHRHLDVLQGNLNHCARAQDLLMQVMAEWGLALAVVAEPYVVPPLPNWVGSSMGFTNNGPEGIGPPRLDGSRGPRSGQQRVQKYLRASARGLYSRRNVCCRSRTYLGMACP